MKFIHFGKKAMTSQKTGCFQSEILAYEKQIQKHINLILYQ